MKKIFLLSALCCSVFSFNALAEWTGDDTNSYYSNEVITEFSVGQIDSGEYFCIKANKAAGTEAVNPVVACSRSNSSVYSHSYYNLMSMAKYFYTTGQSIRIYVQPDTWDFKGFVGAFSGNALVGLATCESDACFGPSK